MSSRLSKIQKSRLFNESEKTVKSECTRLITATLEHFGSTKQACQDIQGCNAVGKTSIDEVIKDCKEICSHMPDGILPPSEWMLRKRIYKNRKIGDWEKASYSKLITNIERVGGIRKVRQHLGLEHQITS